MSCDEALLIVSTSETCKRAAGEKHRDLKREYGSPYYL